MPVSVIASANGMIGMPAAMEVLRSGGTAVDAVIAGTRLVEANPDDHTVGYAALPNMLGDVELDASIMEGRGLCAGSVGALQGYQDAVDVARAVMEQLPHVLVVGNGAARFAAETGFTTSDLLTPEASRIWQSRLDSADAARSASDTYLTKIRDIVAQMAQDPDFAGIGEPPHGTVNFIARDREGNIATAVSTSGWAWKYPGRLGDSPVIGAGNYADNRWGAAACTGRGEMAQRCCTAHSVVMFMRFGMPRELAVVTAMNDLNALNDPFASEMNIVALDADGNPAAASTAVDKEYAFMTEDKTEPEMRPRTFVHVEGVSPEGS